MFAIITPASKEQSKLTERFLGVKEISYEIEALKEVKPYQPNTFIS